MFSDEVVAPRGEGFRIFVSACTGIVILWLDGHLLIDDLKLLAHGKGGSNLENSVVESLHRVNNTSPAYWLKFLVLSLLLLLLSEDCVR